MNEIKRLQQLAGILTEIKVNNPNIIQNFLFDYSEDVGEEAWNVNYDVFYDLLKNNLKLFGLNDENDIPQFIQNFTNEFYGKGNIDDWINPTLNQILDFVKNNNIK